jgi:hypothetical protein
LAIPVLPGVCATEIVGVVWEAQGVGIQLLLNPDGTYRLTGPQGATQGIYLLSGDFLQMQDGATGLVSVYQVGMIGEDVLVLVDGYGGTLQFTPAAGAAPAGGTGKVLAESAGLQLTEADVAVGFDLVRIVTDEALTEAEKDRLRSKAVEEFRAHPAEFLQQVEELRGALGQLRQIRDPQAAGRMRQELFAALYFGTKGIPEEEKPEIVRVILEHVEVVAEDPENRLVLTDRDLETYLEYGDFLAGLSGQEPLSSQVTFEELRTGLAKEYAGLPLETKLGLASIYPVWKAIQKVWGGLEEAQRQAILSQYLAAGASAQGTGPAGGYAGTDPQEVYRRSMDSMRQEVMTGWMRQNLFLNTMNVAAGKGTSFWPNAFE